MKKVAALPIPKNAILTLAEIKAATAAFDRGETNLYDALDAIIVAIEAHRAEMVGDARREPRRRDAA